MPLPPVNENELSDASHAGDSQQPETKRKGKGKAKAKPAAAKPAAAKPAAAKPAAAKAKSKSSSDGQAPSLKRPAAKMEKGASKGKESEAEKSDTDHSLPVMKKPAGKEKESAQKKPAASRNAGKDGKSEKLSVCAYMYKNGVWGIKVNKKECIRVTWFDLQFVCVCAFFVTCNNCLNMIHALVPPLR